jgi:hypothetical protein
LTDDPAGNAPQPAVTIEPLVSIAVEGWRFARVYARAVSKLEGHEQSRYFGQHRYFLDLLDNQLAKVGLRLVAFDGHPYDAGLPLSILNLDEFSPETALVIEQTVEPVVIGPAGVVRMGSAMVKRA